MVSRKKTDGSPVILLIGAFLISLIALMVCIMIWHFQISPLLSLSNITLLNTSFIIRPVQNGTISTIIGQSSVFIAGNLTEFLKTNATGYLAINVSLRNSSQTLILVLFPYFKNLHNLQQYYLPEFGITNGTYTFATLNQTEGTFIYPVVANETIRIRLYNYYYTPLRGNIQIKEVGRRI